MKLLKNIKSIYGILNETNTPLKKSEIGTLNSLENAFIVISDGKIQDFGSMQSFDNSKYSIKETIDCEGQFAMPCYCDSHTHLVFATSREKEFVDRINGLTYEEIALKGGGILNSAEKLSNATEDELFNEASKRLKGLIKLGTGAIEIKSGYGLSIEAEIKMLRVIKRLKSNFDIPIKATFLGAHAFPKLYKEDKDGYIDLIINEMLPKIAQEKLADYIDAFCEVNYFTVPQTEKVMKAGAQHGLKPKIHVNQFNAIGGIKMAIQNNAVSVDHLEVMSPEDIELLSQSSTIATVLPSCSFFLGIPYAPLKEMIENNIAVALATDYNPGSTPSGNMNFVISLACIQQKLTPEQAINAATINGAFAMEVADKVGSITKGKLANIILTKKVKSLYYLPYSFGENCIDKVLIKGEVQN